MIVIVIVVVTAARVITVPVVVIAVRAKGIGKRLTDGSLKKRTTRQRSKQ
jgi:hypothetical protein